MSRFVDDNELKIIQLGGGDWVKIPKRISYGTIAEISKVDNTDVEKTTKLLCAVIREWNLKDDSKKDVPVNEESIKKLDIPTVTKISEAIGEVMEFDKKK